MYFILCDPIFHDRKTIVRKQFNWFIVSDSESKLSDKVSEQDNNNP